MGLGIKKITESVIEDNRSLIMLGTLIDNKISYNDNKAVPIGAIASTPDGTIKIKSDENGNQIGINGATSLQENSVSGDKIKDNAIITVKIQDGAVNSNKLAISAVKTNNIEDKAVTSIKIADNSIIPSKIPNRSILGEKLADGIIKDNHISSDKLSGTVIKDKAIKSNNIDTGAVQSINIQDFTITNVKLQDECVSYNKLDSNLKLLLANLQAQIDDLLSRISKLESLYNNLLDKLLEELSKLISQYNLANAVTHNGANSIDGKNDSTSLVNIKCSGDIEGKRVYFMTYQDLAEAYIPGEDLDPGDIVAMHEDGKVYLAESIDDCIVGVISEDYANCFGATKQELFEGSKVAVGLIGKVLVKIKGPIKIGQQIAVSLSEPGVGCATNTRGIGQALHSIDCDFDEINEVLVQIRPL